MKQNQVVVFFLGAQGSGKTWMADRMVQKFAASMRVSIAECVRAIATDPQVFGVPASSFAHEVKDKPFTFPILVREAHLRSIFRLMAQWLPPSANFKPNSIAVSNFSLAKIKTPRELLQYIGFGVINKLNPHYIPMIAYNRIVGVPGVFVVDDLRIRSELELAQRTFQMVYTVLIKPSKKQKKVSDNKDAGIQYATDELDWQQLTPDFTITNAFDAKSADDALATLVTQIDEAVNKKMAAGNLLPLPPTANEQNNAWVTSKGPIAERNQNVTQFGKGVFTKGKLESQLTSNERIQDHYIQSGSIDRSSLNRRG